MAKCNNCCSNSATQIHQHNHNHGYHDHGQHESNVGLYISLVIFFIGLLLQYVIKPDWFLNNKTIQFLCFLFAYIFVAYPVWKEAFSLFARKDFFNEFSLMGLATLGAFYIGEYPEAVAVMIFYVVGEMFQDAAVNKARGNIKALLDVRPKIASVLRNNNFTNINPELVEIGEIIEVKVGEKVPLDGILLTSNASFNTSALTGESKPKYYKTNETILAGMINLENVVQIRTTKKYNDSSIAKILQLVQEASTHKAKTELFIRKFAKIYTPIVFFAALLITILPALFVSNYVFNNWLYRGLVFLVISCPCALVISVPLGYFGGIGSASRNGILFKGANYLEMLNKVNVVVMDKTGTLTKGVFKVKEIVTENDIEKDEFLNLVSATEEKSNHPIAKAIVAYKQSEYEASNVFEIPGKGLQAIVNNKEVLVGNSNLLKDNNINYPSVVDSIVETLVIVAINKKYAGYLIIADELKEDAKSTIIQLKQNGIKETVMLSGDKDSITQKVAKELGITKAFGSLLPENKVEKMFQIKSNSINHVAFIGDGINDAPVLALSDVGIAMGGLGSDAAIETADVVIQTDQPSKVVTAIKISKETRKIVIQNIVLAISIKLIILVLGAFGIANLWFAVFADVGVALLAILNAVRLQRINFKANY